MSMNMSGISILANGHTHHLDMLLRKRSITVNDNIDIALYYLGDNSVCERHGHENALSTLKYQEDSAFLFFASLRFRNNIKIVHFPVKNALLCVKKLSWQCISGPEHAKNSAFRRHIDEIP